MCDLLTRLNELPSDHNKISSNLISSQFIYAVHWKETRRTAPVSTVHNPPPPSSPHMHAHTHAHIVSQTNKQTYKMCARGKLLFNKIHCHAKKETFWISAPPPKKWVSVKTFLYLQNTKLINLKYKCTFTSNYVLRWKKCGRKRHNQT